MAYFWINLRLRIAHRWSNFVTWVASWLVPSLGIEPFCPCGRRIVQRFDGSWFCPACKDGRPGTEACKCLICMGATYDAENGDV